MTFEELAREGMDGLLTYEPGRPIDEVARELGFGGAGEIIKLASNENALGPSPRAVEAMRDAAAAMHRYPDGGAFHLKNALAAKLGVQPGQVLPTSGSNEAIEFIGHVFLGPDRGLVMADGAFVVYRLVAMMFGAPVTAVPTRNFAHDLDAMRAAIGPQTRVVFVANPDNPSSTMADGNAIERFMDGLPEHVIVCFDEAYIELVEPERQPDTLRYVREGRKVIVLRTFSKTYGLAGLRIGYAVAPEACIGLLNRVRQPFNVNAMAQAAALAALDDDAHVERTRAMVRAGLEQLRDGCARLGLETVPAVANFMLVKVGKGRDAFAALQREGVIVRPMDGYGLPDHVRVTVGTAEENTRCLRALAKVVKAADG